MSVPKSLKNSYAHVREIVKKYDYESYLATLLIRKDLKRTGFALRAFNVELAQVFDLTSTPTTARGRFMFWTSAVEDIYSSQKSAAFDNNPVIAELRRAVLESKGSLSKRNFLKLVDTRAKQVEKSAFPFDTVKNIEDYGEGTIMPIYSLLIESLQQKDKLNHKNLVQLDHISSHLAKSLALVNVLRGVVHNAQRQRVYLPSQLLVSLKIPQEDIIRCTDRKEISDVSYQLACAAKGHLDVALLEITSKQGRCFSSLFLHVYYAEQYLQKLQKENFNVFSPVLHRRQQNLPFKLWMRSLVLRYI